MEIDVTDFVTNEDPAEFSASREELGQDAARITWRNAMDYAAKAPMLTTEDQIEALRDDARRSGGWEPAEIATWSDQHCNALFVQMVAAEMREAHMQAGDLESFIWEGYEADIAAGRVAGLLYRGDVPDSEGYGRIFYWLGV